MEGRRWPDTGKVLSGRRFRMYIGIGAGTLLLILLLIILL